MEEQERLAEKDAYIAEHLMDLQPDTLRFLVADLVFHNRKLTALCDGYRGEVERLKYWDSFLCPRCHGVGEITVMSGQTPENFSQDNTPCPDCVGPTINERDAAIAALTRARAEGMEEAVGIIDSVIAKSYGYGTTCALTAARDAIRARAARGGIVKPNTWWYLCDICGKPSQTRVCGACRLAEQANKGE